MSDPGPDPALPATEDASPRYTTIETWPTAALMDALLENQLAAAAALRTALPALTAAADAAAHRLRNGGCLAYIGAGTSGRIAAQDGAELPPTFAWPRDRLRIIVAGGPAALIEAAEGAEDDTEAALRDTSGLGPADVLVALAASGATPYTLAGLTHATAAGTLTIGIANSPGAPLLRAATHPVLLPTGPEPVAGSTRLGAGTAQKMALNLFSTAVMIRLGRVYRGRMVAMMATNAKLRRRAIRMVAELAPCPPDQAVTALHEAGGDLRHALLIARGSTPAEAAAGLAAAGGNLHLVPPGKR